MIIEIKKYLPLEILEVHWDGTILQISGATWNFTSLSAWRITTRTKMIFGCFDKDSTELIANLKGHKILDIFSQESSLQLDPVFLLTNEQKIEIFSTDTYEPWTFQINELGMYIATPSAPEAFIL